ncbi:MAG: DUF4198 domain-containing protein [Gemmatimonadales bacterium]
MKWRYTIPVGLTFVAATALQAHDFFFRLDSFFVAPNSTVRIRALNGTFSSSENSVTTDRLRDLSVVSSAGREHPDTVTWSSKGDTSVFTLKTGSAGTYVVGASLKTREITLKSADFNTYLADDGIPDVLAARKKNGELAKDATERYSKHIKALLQVGASKTGDFSTVLGYPAEIIPLDNPYNLRPGSTLRVRTMVDGKAMGNQLVVSGGRTKNGKRQVEKRTRSDAAGMARIKLSGSGQWYVKFINMVPYRGAEKINYESKWATLTFEIR